MCFDLLGVILAAGPSTRMGQCKALLTLRGKALVQHHIDALTPCCDHVVVVDGAVSLKPHITGATLVHNPNWASTTMWDSLQLAAQIPHRRMMVTPVDAPPAPRWVLDRLTNTGADAVPTYQGNDGHPVLVTSLVGTHLRECLKDAERVPVDWADTVENLNTPTAWKAWSDH